MSSPSIQRQSILSSLVIFAGFGFGALNLLILQPRILSTEQWGMTRVVTELAVLLASLSTLGTPSVVAKFMPFYRRYLPANRSDLAGFTAIIFTGGLIFTLAGFALAKSGMVYLFGQRTPYFEAYYMYIGLFIFFQAMFMYLEVFAWFAGKTVVSNLLKEFVFRVLTTTCLLLFALKWIDFDGFMLLFGCIYLPNVAYLGYTLYRSGHLHFHFRPSSVTRRLQKKMFSLGSFVFLTGLSNIAFLVCDTLFLASLFSFSKAGIYAIAQYFSQVLEIPMRSMQASSIPLISEYWRAKNYHGLQSIYRKSSMTLLIAGLGLGGLILINLRNINAFFPVDYQGIVTPIALLMIARWINLGTGLNAIIIQLSTYWRFDFISTLSYSLVGIPINYLLIKNFGMMGAAMANILAVALYNGLRWVFLYYKFGLQPFTWQTLLVFLAGIGLIGLVYLIPQAGNLYIDGIWRSALFASLFLIFVLLSGVSEEVQQLWKKWVLNNFRK